LPLSCRQGKQVSQRHERFTAHLPATMNARHVDHIVLSIHPAAVQSDAGKRCSGWSRFADVQVEVGRLVGRLMVAGVAGDVVDIERLVDECQVLRELEVALAKLLGELPEIGAALRLGSDQSMSPTYTHVDILTQTLADASRSLTLAFSTSALRAALYPTRQ